MTCKTRTVAAQARRQGQDPHRLRGSASVVCGVSVQPNKRAGALERREEAVVVKGSAPAREPSQSAAAMPSSEARTETSMDGGEGNVAAEVISAQT